MASFPSFIPECLDCGLAYGCHGSLIGGGVGWRWGMKISRGLEKGVE